MRPTHVLLSGLLIAGMADRAESQVFVGSAAVVGGRSAVTEAAVVDRVIAFDRDGDGRVDRSELIDRMQHLVSRGDADGDGALDAPEIRTLARMPPAVATGGFPIHVIYQIQQESWFPTRKHVRGAIDDLKLSSEARDRALAVAEAHEEQLEAVERETSAKLLLDMQDILPPHQLSRLRSALQTRSGFQAMTVTSAGDGTARIAVLGANLARHIEQFGLTPSANSKAHAAVARYQAALTRRGEDERAVLVGRMRGIMTGEERESFDASLQRRSALAIGRPGEAGGIVGGVVAGLPEPPADPVTRPEP
jgi:hypothetical protein